MYQKKIWKMYEECEDDIKNVIRLRKIWVSLYSPHIFYTDQILYFGWF